jgi:thymidylate kinase
VTGRALRVAIEGPCCAGKTTMGRGLREALHPHPLVSVADYSDFVGGGRFLPPAVPANLDGEEAALLEFLAIEQARTLQARALKAAKGVILIDRSIHTLLAHCAALTNLTGTDYLSLAQRVLRASPVPLWPDLVLYLDVTQETIHTRNRGKFPPGSIFVDPTFNAGIRSYFESPRDPSVPEITWLEGAAGARLLRDLAAERVEASIGTQSDDGEVS